MTTEHDPPVDIPLHLPDSEFLATYWLGRQDSANLPYTSLSSDLPKRGTAESELRISSWERAHSRAGDFLNSHTNTFLTLNINNAI